MKGFKIQNNLWTIQALEIRLVERDPQSRHCELEWPELTLGALTGPSPCHSTLTPDLSSDTSEAQTATHVEHTEVAEIGRAHV